MNIRKIELIVITITAIILIPLIIVGFTLQIFGRVCIVLGAILMLNPISAKNEFKDLVDEIKDLWTKN